MDENSARVIRNLVLQNGEPVGHVMQKVMDTKLDERAKPCAKCGGTGWRYIEGTNDPRVVRCVCHFETQAEQLLKAAQIPARYTRCEFANYRTDKSSLLARAKLSVEGWAEQYPLDRRGVLLLGVSGVGKTHLAASALKALIKKGFHCLFCDYRDLLKEIQNSYNPSVETTELELLQPVFDAEVLLLDDLGAIKPSQWVWDTVSLILNNRYNRDRTTLITSNFIDGPAAGTEEAEEFDSLRRPLPEESSGPSERGKQNKKGREETLGDRIGNRMRSRLFEMCRPVLLVGQDYRRELRAASLT